jgi:TolB-like protein/Tfp pilus assembly protein PilF
LANGLTSGLIADLMRFDGMAIFNGQNAGDGSAALPAAAAGAPAYVLAGTVERAPDRIRVTARLTERATGEVLWSQSYDRALTTAGIFDVEAELTGAIAGRLAQTYGVISTDATKRLVGTRPATLFAYDCVQRAFAYRKGAVPALYPPVRACLDEAVQRDPDYAAAWAMLAFAHMDAVRFGFATGPTAAGEMRAGLAAARQAVELAPDSVTSRQALAALLYRMGEVAEAEQEQRRAIALNPQDPESLAQLGWRLSVQGRPKEGATLLREALDRSAAPPPWYHSSLALSQYLAGDFAAARDSAERGRTSCCGVGPIILALAEIGVGDLAAARSALDEAIRQAPILATDPPAFFRNFGVGDGFIAHIRPDLAKIGLRFPLAP